MSDEQKPRSLTFEQWSDEMDKAIQPAGAIYKSTSPRNVKPGDVVLTRLSTKCWGHSCVEAVEKYADHVVVKTDNGWVQPMFSGEHVQVLIKTNEGVKT
jgi:hypothetical protein